MKTNIKLFFLVVVVPMIFLSGCQEEVIKITEPQNDTVINSQSPVVNLIQQAAMSDGSSDNILDNSSCTLLVLPVTVIANGQEIVIATEADFILVERIFDESDTDVDVVELVFPVTVILADHTEVTVANYDEYEDLVEDCVEGGFDVDIECIDFVYPLDIAIYDAANQVSDVITINNDEELFDLFEELHEDDYISFTFPLTLILIDGTEVVVTDNEGLEDILEEVADDCDEDDDNDHNDDDIDDSDLINVLLDGEWVISYFFNEADETAAFHGYGFIFFDDGSAVASDGNIEVEGAWETYGDDGELEIELNFGSESPFDELEEDWHVIEFGPEIIKLRNISDDHAQETFLTFEKPTNHGVNHDTTISEVLVEGIWLVANFNISGVDATDDYHGFEFTYNTNGTAEATDGTETINGEWSEIYDSGIHKLELDFGAAAPFDEFAEDWEVVSFTETRIELRYEDGGNGSTNILVFERF